MLAKKKAKTVKEESRALVQVWVTPKAKRALAEKAAKEGLQVASYVRRLIYCDICTDDAEVNMKV